MKKIPKSPKKVTFKDLKKIKGGAANKNVKSTWTAKHTFDDGRAPDEQPPVESEGNAPCAVDS